MCLIIIKPKNIALPDAEVLSTAWANNPDGAGLAIRAQNGIKIIKGFLDETDFQAAIYENITDDAPAMLHFRVATHGSVRPENCHPFPLSNSIAELGAQDLVTDIALAHNGMLLYPDDAKADLSDTATFIRDVLSDEIIRENLRNSAVQKLLHNSIDGSKLAIFDRKGFHLIGEFLEHGGCYYSNDSFLRSRSSWAFEDVNFWEREYCQYCGEKHDIDAIRCKVCNNFYGDAGL